MFAVYPCSFIYFVLFELLCLKHVTFIQLTANLFKQTKTDLPF